MLLGIATLFAQDVNDFMERYEAVVERAMDLNSSDYDSTELQEVKKEYDKLTRQVDKYKKQMTNEDLKKYYKLKAKYQKKMATISAKRGASKVSGWFRGLFE